METSKTIKLGENKISNDINITFIAGPCAMESRDHAIEMASAIKEISKKHNIHMIYKSSFDKANRTSIKSGRGIGIQKAMPIFSEIQEIVGLPVVTDVHSIEECRIVGDTVDVIQISISMPSD